MKQWVLIFFLLFFLQSVFAQTDDIFILQKNGSNLKTFAVGMSFSMETIYDQWFDGTITGIRHDSVFLNGIAFHYKEIKTIRIERTKLNYTTDGVLLMIAGAGVLVLGAVNGLYRGDPASEWYHPASYITAGV